MQGRLQFIDEFFRFSSMKLGYFRPEFWLSNSMIFILNFIIFISFRSPKFIKWWSLKTLECQKKLLKDSIKILVEKFPSRSLEYYTCKFFISYIQNLYLDPATTQFVIIRKVGLKWTFQEMWLKFKSTRWIQAQTVNTGADSKYRRKSNFFRS